MNWLHDMPLGRKLTRVVLVTCSAVLLLACASLGTYEILAYRRAMARDMMVLADILAKNTRAALAFDYKEEAQSTLRGLESEPHVVGACLYHRDGSLFAEYTRPG